ncbi:HAD-IIA family hydrolase [Eubacterium callanderi]|uniref:HAD-IIA family hydrolase n=1 Tax=Eubacterium callanderi TaxID=53442 RepID=UPI0030809CB5
MQNFALDMDGTIYLDETWIDGAKVFLERIEQTGRNYCFMTNNSSKNAEIYVEKLHKMGLDIDPQKQLITSGHATIDYLKRNFPEKSVYLFGNKALMDEFEKNGICLEEDHPDVLISAFDTSFNYTKLCKFCDLVREGLPYIGTHPDYNCPTQNGFVPDIGAFHAYVSATTGRMPDKIIGKPNKEIIDYTLNVLSAKPENTAVVGDRLYTDVKSGVFNGLFGILVLSGEARLADLPGSDVKPHLVFDSVKNITPLL